MKLVLAHVNDPIPSAIALAPHLPPAVDDFFRCLLAKHACDRPDRATDVARLLSDALR
jgi:hypothetical protein